MSFTKVFFVVALAVATVGLCEAQCFGRVVRTVVPIAPPPCNPYNDDLATILQLAKAINVGNAPCSSTSCSSYTGSLNVEDIIMKLVNALIYTTTQNGRSSGGSNLIDLGLLGKNGNLLDLGLGGQGVLGVGLGQ